MLNLLQLDTPYLPNIYTPYLSGLWCITLDGSLSFTDSNGVTGTIRELAQMTPTIIGQLRIGLLYYDEVESIEECWNNPATYYYKADTYQIIVNISDASGTLGYQIPWGLRIEVGIITGYSDHVDYKRPDNAYYKDMYYPPIISSISDYTAKRDKLFFGVNSYTSVDIDMDNLNGHFDSMDLLGCVARLYALDDGSDLSADKLSQYGFVTKYNRGNKKVSITIGDRRQSLDTNVDLGRINVTTYPYLYDADDDKSDDDTKVIPIAIGVIKNYKPTLIDKANHAANTASYILCKCLSDYGLRGVSDVWVQQTDDNSVSYDMIIPAAGQTIANPAPLSPDSKYATVSTYTYSIDYGTGLLSLERGAIETATINDTEVSYSYADVNVNFTGWTNKTNGENINLCGADLIKIGLSEFAKIDFESWNIDFATWYHERIKSVNQVLEGREFSLLIDSDMTITDYFKKVCESFDMIMTGRGDGRYAIKIIEKEKAGTVKYEISSTQLIDRTDNDNSTLSEVLSTVKIGYGYAGNSDNDKTLTDDSREIKIQQLRHTTKESEFDTCLATQKAAQLKATVLLDASENITPSSDFTLWSDTETSHLDVVDTIIAPTGRLSKRAIFNITQIKRSKTKNTTTITANKIANTKYDPGYVQGRAFGVTVFGVDPYGITQSEE